MVGRLAPWKGQHVFLEAFARAFPAGGAGADEGTRSAEALLVGSALFGEDDYVAALHAQVADLGLEGRVRFTGFVDDVAALLAEVDVVVHASVVAEPFGQVVVEAMAAGRPVIASDLGGPAEVVTDGVDGLLSPAGDADALAACLVRLADDAGLRLRLGRAAAATAHAYEPAVVAPRLVAVLAQVARSSRRRVARRR